MECHVSNKERKSLPPQKMPSDENSDSDEEEEVHDKVSLPAMTFMQRRESTASITSIYSASCGKGDYEISGKLLLGIWYKEEQLFVRVTKATNIAAAKENGFSNPYIKTYLLPDKNKQTKRKTTVNKKTLHPVYNEILKVGVCCEPCIKQLHLVACGFSLLGIFLPKLKSHFQHTESDRKLA